MARDPELEKKRELAKRALMGEHISPEDLLEAEEEVRVDEKLKNNPASVADLSSEKEISNTDISDIEERLRKGGVNRQPAASDFPDPTKNDEVDIQIPKKEDVGRKSPEPIDIPTEPKVPTTPNIIESKESQPTPETKIVPEQQKNDEFYRAKEAGSKIKPILNESGGDIYREDAAVEAVAPEVATVSLVLPRQEQSSVTNTVEKIKQAQAAKVITAQALPTNRQVSEWQRHKKAIVVLSLLIIGIIVLIASILIIQDQNSRTNRTGDESVLGGVVNARIDIATLPGALINSSSPDGQQSVTFVINVAETGKQPLWQAADTNSVLSSLDISLDDSFRRVTTGTPVLLRETKNFAFGFYTTEFSRTLGGLLAWEDVASQEMVNLRLANNITNNVEDITLQNIDFRNWRDSDLAYTIDNGELVIIGSSPEFILGNRQNMIRALAQARSGT